MLYTIRRRRLLLLLLATRQAMFKTHSPPRKRDSDQGSFVTYSGGLVDFLRGIDSTQPLTTNTASLTREPSKPHVLLHVPMMLFCRAQSSLCGCISAPLGNYIHKPNKQKKDIDAAAPWSAVSGGAHVSVSKPCVRSERISLGFLPYRGAVGGRRKDGREESGYSSGVTKRLDRRHILRHHIPR